MQLGKKIILSSILAAGATLVIAVTTEYFVMRSQGSEMIADSMRGIIVAAESIRSSVSKLNLQGAFRREELIEEFKKSGGDLRQSTIYDTIPIVATWRSIEQAAKKEGYGFRVVKQQARNPKNLPDAEEAEVLRKLESGQEEYRSIDPSKNSIVYARPIRLTADCLTCHGDPATSPTKDGKDFLGFKMENWKEGEIHGAFILRTDFGSVNVHSLQSLKQGLGYLVPTFVVFSLGLVLLLRQTTRHYIVKPIAASITTIKNDAEREVLISAEISRASTTLAEAATEQAASLEETSATLEEISGMTRRNAENADTAQGLAAETRRAADTGSTDMQDMIRAMNEIKAASDNIAAIIKTIDEIAFQTNILALNAAVEAARAGEAGAGFAVVADEVRALAQRSAHAAKETAEKIEDSISKSEHGVAVSGKVSKSLTEIVERARKMDELVREIAAGSKEQAQGISQVNEAITQLDKVTQSNAATAETAASASTELKTQSEGLAQAVENLVSVVGSTDGEAGEGGRSS